MPRTYPGGARLPSIIVALSLSVAACGGGSAVGTPADAPAATERDEAGTTEAEQATVPAPAETRSTDAGPPAGGVSIDAGNGTVTLDAPASSIVSLSPTATEMLFAVGAGDRVVAVDDQSDHPPEAPVTDLSGFTPNVEAIAAYEPDLVVVSQDIDGVVGALEAVGIPVAVLPAATVIDDTYAQIEAVGTLTGRVEEASELVEEMQEDVESILASVSGPEEPLTYYHELDPTLYTVTSETFIGQVYGMLGLENIADPADEDGSGYPQLTAEYVIEQDPDLVFLADAQCCDVTPESIAERPGWENLSAVAGARVHAVDEDVASRWGPRVVEFLEIAAGAVSQAAG